MIHLPVRSYGDTDRAQRSRDIVSYAILILIPIIAVTIHVLTYTKLSPIDELQHIDSLYRAPDVVAPGDQVGYDAMREESCRGIDADFAPPPCVPAAQYNARSFQENGYNTSAGNSPIYYTLAKVVGASIVALTPADDLVTGARLAGGVFLALGLCLTFWTSRRWGIRRRYSIPILIVLALTPSVLFASATVNPDALIILVGASLVFALTLWEASPRRLWMLGAVSALIALIKLTNLVLVAAVGIYALVRAYMARRVPPDESGDDLPARAWTRAGVVVIGSALATTLLWLVYMRARTHGDPNDIPMNVVYHVTSFRPEWLLERFWVLAFPLSDGSVSVGPAYWQNFSQSIGSYLLIGSLIAGALVPGGSVRTMTLARAAVLAAVVCGAGFIVTSYISSSVYVSAPSRYGASLLALLALIGASRIGGRFSAGALWALAAMTAAATMFRLM